MDKGIDPLVGKTVAQYEVVARLGGGGMGVVYSARDTKLGRRVALKFLPPRWSHDENSKQRFVREAQAASSTDHRNICTIHDIETAEDGQLFIVMAHYDGETLKERLERGGLTLDEAVDIAAQVAEGLAKAHAQGVVHRDIKPGNLMLTDEGVKILDFGLAKLAAESLKLTLEGSTLGTVAYMSPEQARGDDADARSDVWALGVVLYEMIAGEAPFKGAYAEAISHAIRTAEPPPLTRDGREIPEQLERLIGRTLTKNADERVQSARELARELRMLQGRTIPLDLRTEPLPRVTARGRSSRRLTGQRAIGLAAVAVAVMVGTPLWLFSPVDRVPVAIAPVVNQTGYTELDPYRMALTETLIDLVSGSRVARPLPFDRLLQIVRRFQPPAGDISSREAIQALTTNSGARVVIVPVLLYESGGWKARIEFRDPLTATSTASFETPAAISSLMKDTVYGLMAPLAAGIREHFVETGPRRAYAANVARRLGGRAPPAPRPSLAALDAAAEFAKGRDAYEQQEYSTALQSFTMAARLDSRSPLPLVWRARTARIMRRDREAVETAQMATALLTDQSSEQDRLFVEAVAAELGRDLERAEMRYRALAARAPDEAAWLAELGAFQDRQSRASDAIASHNAALALDGQFVRSHLDLCRLYNPNEIATARAHGEQALNTYRALGARAGEGQALWCLADILRVGSAADIARARQYADAALAIFSQLQYPYNLSRAYNYVALTAVAQGRIGDAVGFWEKSLAGARQVGNAGLQPLVLMNLGVMQVRLGNRSRAVDYYRQSAKDFEALGQEQRAAEFQANAGAILIENGGNPEQGLRDVQNALAVSRKLGNRNFEVFAAQVTAAYYRYAGRHQDAERELNRAIAIALERDLKDRASLSTDRARSRMDLADYEGARKLLVDAIAGASGAARTHARIRLGQTYTRLGDFDSAQRELTQAAEDLRNGADPELVPVLDTANGELAYARGNLRDARSYFTRASGAWTDDLPDAASVEARAYQGLIDALAGQADSGRRDVVTSLDQAHKMRRVSLETLCRLFLAQIDIGRRRFDDALRTLNEVTPDDASQTVGRELRAQVHYWKAQAHAGRNESAEVEAEIRAARARIDEIRASLPESSRARFAARRDIRRIGG